MYLGNPLLPIKISSTDAENLIVKEINKKNWVDFELNQLKLNLVPYFLFNYHYYLESDNDNKNVIKSTVHGILSIDGHEIKVRPDFVDLLKYNWKHTIQEVPRGEFIEKYCNIDKKDQLEVLKLKTAQYFNVSKQNVVISDSKRILIPFYRTTLKVGGNTYKISVNSVDGRIEGIKEIPQRQKGYLEITKETINELKTPSNWIKYSKEVIEEIFSFVIKPKKNNSQKNKANNSFSKQNNKKINLEIFESRGFLILIILLAILLIIASIFRIKFF